VAHCYHEVFTPSKDGIIPDWLHDFVAYKSGGNNEVDPNATYFLDSDIWGKDRSITITQGTSPRQGGCTISEHSERNAIAFAARYGLALEGSEMHVTHAPCLACARVIINSGIKKVTYAVPYRLTEGVELLTQAGIQVVDMEGYEG
jgi:deoxycytidylate deaminase